MDASKVVRVTMVGQVEDKDDTRNKLEGLGFKLEDLSIGGASHYFIFNVFIPLDEAVLNEREANA